MRSLRVYLAAILPNSDMNTKQSTIIATSILLALTLFALADRMPTTAQGPETITERVSVASDDTQGNGEFEYLSISTDGRDVASGSLASNLVTGDIYGIPNSSSDWLQMEATSQAASGWPIETVDSLGDVGKSPSLALDVEGHPHISYYDVTNGDLKYAYRDAVSWYVQTVDSAGDVGTYSSLAACRREDFSPNTIGGKIAAI